MELKSFVEVGLRRWPVVLLAFLLTLGLTFELALSQEDTYESCGTFVVRPRSGTGSEGAALDALVRGPEINATYASIAKSGAVRKSAKERLDSSIDADGVRVSAEVTTGTNTISICARGSDPTAAYALADAVGDATVEYVGMLDETYDLVPLDRAEIPADPEPSRTSLTIAVGAFCGLLFGFVLASVLEFLTATWRAARNRERARASDGPAWYDPDPAAVQPARPFDVGSGTAETQPDPEPAADDGITETTADLDDIGVSPRAGASTHRTAFEALLDEQTTGRDPVGYVIVHAVRVESIPGDDQNHDDPQNNGSVVTGTSPKLLSCLRDWARENAGDVIQLDAESFVAFVPDVTPTEASRLLAGVAAAMSMVDLTTEAPGWTLELAMGVHRRVAEDDITADDGNGDGDADAEPARSNGRAPATTMVGPADGPMT